MKIVLSRKGFDSANGGVPSPIFPDGRLLSLPITASSSPTRFADCRWGDHDLGTLVESLTAGRVRADRAAHLDPDLDFGARPRESGWRPAFGQTGTAQTHLARHGIGTGDLFLFFGWFREAEGCPGGGWRFRRNAPDLHVLFGWLQVAEVLPIGERTSRYARQYPWLKDHPHLWGDWAEPNTVYVASETLSVFGDKGLADRRGGGVFSAISTARTLSAPEQTQRSTWRLPGWFFPTQGALSLSYHDKPERWARAPDGSTRLQTVARGQEFVLIADRRQKVSHWLSAVFC